MLIEFLSDRVIKGELDATKELVRELDSEVLDVVDVAMRQKGRGRQTYSARDVLRAYLVGFRHGRSNSLIHRLPKSGDKDGSELSPPSIWEVR